MSERETQTFMSVTVDSFSELPFVRPMPAPDSSSSSCPSIRLFGIEFPHELHTSTTDTTITPNGTTNASATNNNCGSGGEIGRNFECHYCRRNFPTSQALGGHQNAHKRERQDAKRAHLQSVIAAHHHHHHPGLITNGRMYGLVGYHGLGSVPSAGRFETPPPPHHPSWNGTSTSMSPRARFYGRPLPRLWRAPVHGGAARFGMIHRDPETLPLFGVDGSRMVGIGGGGSIGSYSSSSTSPQDRGGFGSGEKSVSLDLHL